MIHFACSHPLCRKKLKIDDRGAGLKINCPRCQQPMLVPLPVRHPGEALSHPLETEDSEEILLPCDPTSGNLDPTISLAAAADNAVTTRKRRRRLWILGGAFAGLSVLFVVLVVGWVSGVNPLSGMLGITHTRISKAEFENIAESCRSKKELIERLGIPTVSFSRDFGTYERWGYDDVVLDPATNQPFGRAILVLYPEHEAKTENKIVAGIRYITVVQK
jgi:hypothetical protein